MTVYIEVTTDRYSHIIQMADSLEELAKLSHTTKKSISSHISHHKKGEIKTERYAKVEITEDDDELE